MNDNSFDSPNANIHDEETTLNHHLTYQTSRNTPNPVNKSVQIETKPFNSNSQDTKAYQAQISQEDQILEEHAKMKQQEKDLEQKLKKNINLTNQILMKKKNNGMKKIFNN